MQHVVNEITFIVVCLYLILSTPGVYQDFNRMFESTSGDILIVFISLFVIFNLLVILIDLAWNWVRPHCIRRENIISFRELNRHLKVLINRRNETQAHKLKQLLKPQDKTMTGKEVDQEAGTFNSKTNVRIIDKTLIYATPKIDGDQESQKKGLERKSLL